MTWIEKHYGRLEEQPGFEEFHHEYSAAIKEVDTKIEILSEDFAVRHDYNPIHHIEKRLKTPQGIEDKLRRLQCEVSIPSARENILDIAGIRVVCNFVEDVYEVAHMLTSQNDIRVNTCKDYIANPKPNGYRSLHLSLMVPVFLLDGCIEVPVEVQIRTVAMDFWASLEHQLRYKKDKEIPPRIDIELKACAEVSATLDKRMQKIFNELNKL
ncbi:MAG: GTP pyrophosphokinase family protein [Firmicutes bacterium]|nr:GTP pyrophosphokinase family protein [Bacillota bacterium]